MRLSDQLHYIRRNMKKNKVRVFMTILATTMGCAFLIVLASVGFGVHKSTTEEMTKYQLLTEIQVNGREVNGHYEPMKEEDIHKLREEDNVNAVVGRVRLYSGLDITLDGRSANVEALLTDMVEEERANLELEAGKIPTDKNEVIVGYHFAKGLLTEAERAQQQLFYEKGEGELPTGFDGELIGKTLTVLINNEEGVFQEQVQFVISGISKAPTRDWVEDRVVYISNEFRDQLFTAILTEEELEMRKHNPFDQVRVFASSINHVEDISKSLKEQGYYVYSISDELKGMNLFFSVLKAGLIFVGTITVLIASIGIFNTMTMAVTERTQDIGIMKAIGGSPSFIRKMFLMECAIIGVLGSMIGVVISYGISWAANVIIPLILEAVVDTRGPVEFTFSHIPLSLVIIAASISIGVAILSGLRPAIKATNINVLSALRREM
ncbi:macrolide ABC transporter permease [Anaerobacillus alkaliphilus]|uniref:Macrolide ABC transporter permease n=1 Tax=Anaerobacillus alkaliphilus TaxID=1548597 RepID=A0A4V1LGV9_9BACI|nr:macrolide ABC transporter permease [Anaerobacillus alkaliphilus]